MIKHTPQNPNTTFTTQPCHGCVSSGQICDLAKTRWKVISFIFGIAILGGLSAAYIHFAMFSTSLLQYFKDIQDPHQSWYALEICVVLYMAVVLSIGRFLALLLFPFTLRRWGPSFAKAGAWLVFIGWLVVGGAQLWATIDAWIWYYRFEAFGPNNLARGCFIWRAVATVMLVVEGLGFCAALYLCFSAIGQQQKRLHSNWTGNA
jgi:hypothetical protein